MGKNIYLATVIFIKNSQQKNHTNSDSVLKCLEGDFMVLAGQRALLC